MREELKIIKKNPDFPLNLEIFKDGMTIDLSNNLIFFVGENGSGKSTILDIIAYFSNANRIAYESKYNAVDFRYLKGIQKNVKLILEQYKNKIYFRSEDFITYINYLHKEKEIMKEEIKRVNIEYKDKSNFTKAQALAPFTKTLYEIESMYERDLLEQSHGQSYLDFFSSRLRENSLVILDEPESALSFNSLLVLISYIKKYINEGCKFIIATHSPVLMAMKEGIIYEVQETDLKVSKYEDLEQIQLLKQFLNNPEGFLRYL